MGNSKISKTRKTLLILGSVFGILVVFLIVAHNIYVKQNETLLYKIQQHLTYSKDDWENYETNQKILAAHPAEESVITEVLAAPDKYDLYPVDIDRIPKEFKQEELEKIRKANFEALAAVKNGPDNEDAQAALIRFVGDRLTEAIIHQKLNVKVGTCYENPEKDDNFQCVSCMVLLYHRDKKQWVEAPNGDNFMRNAYDFSQGSNGGMWEARDLSMRIPFDHALFKKYSSTSIYQ